MSYFVISVPCFDLRLFTRSFKRKFVFLCRKETIFNIFTMPFYAVALGHIPGVYKTWEECQKQTKGYPKAIFKKFNTQTEAIDFVKSQGKTNFSKETVTSNIETNILTTSSIAVENIFPPDLINLTRSSSRALLKQDKTTFLSQKLDKFIEETNKKLNEFSTRLCALEDLNFSTNTPERKRKSDDESNEVEKVKTRKKKTLITVEVAGDEDGEEVANNKMTRSKSQQPSTSSANGDAEEVDGPWAWGNDPLGSGFIRSPDGYVIVFTDGACSQNGRAGAKAGIGVWFNHNNPFNMSAPVEGSATNNNAEIQAATRAIEQANLAGITCLNIHTDSEFLINCITKWIKKWKKNNWLTANGGPVKNKEQLILLDNIINTMDAVKWTHVRGHRGHVGNECADALARKGAMY